MRTRKPYGGAFTVRALPEQQEDALDALLAPRAPSAAPSSPATTAAATSSPSRAQVDPGVADSDSRWASAAFAAAADVAASSTALASSPGASVPTVAEAGAARRHRRQQEEVDGAPEFALVFLLLVMISGALAMYLLSDTFLDAARHARHTRKMHDTTFNLIVSLEAVYTGATVQSEFPGGRQIVCPHCAGSGGHGPNGVSTCSACDGVGFKQIRRQIAPGFFQAFQQTCNVCGGRGSLLEHACHECAGAGLLKDHTTPLNVALPPGMPEGWSIHLRGAGDQPHPRDVSVQGGDVVVTVHTRPHPRFQRRGPHLHLKHTLTLRQALLGFTHQLTLLDGSTVTIERSEPTSPGSEVRLEGLGLPAFDEAAARESELPSGTGLVSMAYSHVLRPLERAVDRLGSGLVSVLTAGRPRKGGSGASSPSSRSTPRGDLIVEFSVQMSPRGHRFNKEETELLKRLLQE